MLFLDFCATISSGDVLGFLRDKGVLRRTYPCNKCGRSMASGFFGGSQDGGMFRCAKCKTQKSVRAGSFLVDCRLSLQKFASLLYLLQTEIPYKYIAELLEIEANTVTDYANLLREECSRDLIENADMLGGPGCIVQIDESLLAKAKRTRNNHARPIREQWIFGAYDVQRKVGMIELVDSRDAATLLPLIQSWCLPGTIVVSDGWPAYTGLSTLGFEHRVVIHEQHFVDPETGGHTNNVEAYWQRCKRRFKRMYGTSRELLASHIDEFLWQERHGKTFCTKFENMLGLLYNHYKE